VKKLYLIGGTMGVGKTTVSKQLKLELDRSVFLDGDWCWDAHPFQVTDETKTMVIDNITHLLNNFLICTAYENVIFCWVMDHQSIIDSIVGRLESFCGQILPISLVCSEDALTERIRRDVRNGLRQPDAIERSLARLPLYDALNTVKIDTTGKTVTDIVRELVEL